MAGSGSAPAAAGNPRVPRPSRGAGRGRRSSCRPARRTRRRRSRARSSGGGHRAVGIHGVDLEVAVARGREDDARAVGRDGGLGVVAGVLSIAAGRSRRAARCRCRTGAAARRSPGCSPDGAGTPANARGSSCTGCDRRTGRSTRRSWRPVPVETMRTSVPSAFMVKIWSQLLIPGRVAWKMSWRIGGEVGLGVLAAVGEHADTCRAWLSPSAALDGARVHRAVSTVPGRGDLRAWGCRRRRAAAPTVIYGLMRLE
jgi:hypothetical protein